MNQLYGPFVVCGIRDFETKIELAPELNDLKPLQPCLTSVDEVVEVVRSRYPQGRYEIIVGCGYDPFEGKIGVLAIIDTNLVDAAEDSPVTH